MPGWPHLSAGSLRHLEPSTGTAWHGWLDQGYFSAVPTTPEAGVSSHQPFLLPSGGGIVGGSPSAKDFFVLGAWNINSRDPAAWEYFLRGATGAWRADGGGPFESPMLSGPLFFTRPSGAGQAKWGASVALDFGDEGLMALPSLAAEAAQGAQLVRRVDEGRLKVWSQKIIELQPTCGWPYASLRSFAGSGLLARSLQESRVNIGPADVAPGWPLHLEAADLLEAWAPLLTVRGDTFRVIGQAEGVEGAVACEFLVQRVAEDHPFQPLGRRFRIISVRIRNP
jgi:hypothetical protein